MALKILVCGSRTWNDWDTIKSALLALATTKDITVIHGAARGADQMAGITAMNMSMKVQEFKPNWDKHGRKAGLIRNLEMLDQEPDLVIAFQKGKSRGTQHTIDHARKRGIPTKVYTA